MGKGSKEPDYPDPRQTAAAQSAANREAVREAALVNQIGINSPYGRQFYTGEIGTPERALNIELSPSGQRIQSAQQQLAELISGYGASDLGPSVTGRLSQEPGTAGDVFYELGESRLDPRYRRAEERLHSRLLGQGLPVSSRAYQTAMEEFGEQEEDAFRRLALESEARGFAEDRAQRSQAINELAALLQGAPAIGTPATMMPGQYNIAPPDIEGLTAGQYAADLGRYNRQAQQLGGLYNLIGSGAGLFL